MARSPNSKVLPFPATDQERLDAIKLHKQAVSNKQPIPYFIKEDGTTHYVDNKGRGRYAFNDLATKLRNEASRKATKKSLTPTLSDYKNVFGEEKGPTMYAEEQARLKKIYRVTPTATHDVDHIASQADKGPHHSRNLRAQNLARNRSEGQRGLTQQQRSDMLIGKTPKEHIAIQGPQMTPRQRQTYLKVGLATSGGGIGLQVIEQALTKAAKSALSPSSKMMDVAAEVAGTMLPEEIQQNPMVQQTLGIMSAPLPAQAKAALTILQPTPLASGELKDNQ